ADLGEVDVVLLSHDQHADNLDTAGREFLASVDTVFSTVDAAARIDGVQGLVAWDTAKLDGPAGQITVTAVPALHGPEGCEPISGVVIGFVLQAEGKLTVYISGDNAAVDRVQDIVDRIGRIDIAVLFTGAANPGRYGDTDVTLNARTAVAAARILADAVVIPIHAEGWAHFSETLERLAREFDYAGLASRLRIPSPGERFTV
ncbi:MAG: MBL fold metallo-hydrolase, partial [Mycobacteriaceae bacterium]|nr:MBL fold metallo-hydrolase [Mycobacteriaceae bacterium]